MKQETHEYSCLLHMLQPNISGILHL